MGMFKEGKAELAAKHASRALQEGHRVLVFRIDIPRNTIEGTPVSGVAEQIEAIEGQGWVLDRIGDLNGIGIAVFKIGYR